MQKGDKVKVSLETIKDLKYLTGEILTIGLDGKASVLVESLFILPYNELEVMDD